MAKPKLNLVVFPTDPARSSGSLVPAANLSRGRFTDAECREIEAKFHEHGVSIKKLSIAFSVGHSLIEAIVRVPRKPMASAAQLDRRRRRVA